MKRKQTLKKGKKFKHAKNLKEELGSLDIMLLLLITVKTLNFSFDTATVTRYDNC